jgi:hypothetical protein
MDLDTYNDQVARHMTEKQLQHQVGALARTHGWRIFHVTWSPGTTPGWPDCVLIHPQRQRVLYRELKTARGRLSPAQADWLDTLTRAGQDAAVWNTHDLINGTIEQELCA